MVAAGQFASCSRLAVWGLLVCNSVALHLRSRCAASCVETPCSFAVCPDVLMGGLLEKAEQQQTMVTASDADGCLQGPQM